MSRISWNGGAVRYYAKGRFVMRGPQIVKVCRTKRGAKREAERRIVADYERVTRELHEIEQSKAKRAARKVQRVTDDRRQVRASFDADSGLIEVFPADPEGTGFMLGVRPDVGSGAFVRATAAQAARVAAMLAPTDGRST